MGNNELTLALRLEGTTGAASVEVERLVDVAAMVATLPDPDIDPVFAAKLEQRLLTEGLAAQVAETPEPYQGLRVVRTPQTQPAPARTEKLAPNVIALPRRRYVMRKALVAAIAAAMALAMPVAMASTALPGSPGYAIKEMRRSIQLHFMHGNELAFKMEHQAREYLAEAAQLAAIGGRSNLIEATLAKANRLLALATQITIRSGQPAAIARLRSMIERDGDMLRAMLPTAGDKASFVTAIDHVEDLSEALARAMGIVLAEPGDIGPAVESIAASVSAPSSNREASSKSPSGSNQGGSTTPSAPRAPKLKDPGGHEKPATPGGCSDIGGAQLGDTLDVLSNRLCAGSPDNAGTN